MSVIRIKSIDGQEIAFEDKVIGQGGMKDVYFSPDKSYVVAFFRDKQDANARERLSSIVSVYRERLYNQAGGEYWKKLFCWPTHIVEHEGKLGVVAPTYASHFFFQHGSTENDKLSLKGKEKEGKWFASARHQIQYLDPRERGNWMSYFRICILISRAIRRMHAAGLAHSDLSYKNILVDPAGGNACIIDIDGLVVSGKFPPGVVGTPDFIAPEVMQTRDLSSSDKNKKLPCKETDQHALAVLIYMYLLYRHPLKGRKVHDLDDTDRDEFLAMGEKALFIEDPSDHSNRYDWKWVERNEENNAKYYAPWMNLDIIPYTVLGPYLSPLVKQAFVTGLHSPHQRPSADDWETALVKTVDLMQPCQNKSCSQQWYVFDNTTKPRCPFCGTPFNGQLPILNFYSRKKDSYNPDNYRLMVYHNQYLYPWHVNRNVFPNERLNDSQKKPVGYFSFHQGNWCFVNQTLSAMNDLTEKKDIPINSMVMLKEGKQLLLSPEEGGRLVYIQLLNA
ncbi:MAG: kinase [SAR324 cluster bacterium]|nr:kinase [SAR324 cluster bacterium]